MQETQEMYVQSLGQEDPLEKEMATCFSILSWKIPWTEEPGQAIVHGATKSQTQLTDQVHTPTKDGVCFPTHWQWTVHVTLTKGTWVVSTPEELEVDYCNFFFLVLCPWVINHEDLALVAAAPSVWDKKTHVEKLNHVSSLEPSLEQDHLL